MDDIQPVVASEVMVIVLMGVSGSGKSTVGKLLAEDLDWPFVEADDYHPAENIKKMQRGVPLSDEDRLPWLKKLQAQIDEACTRGENMVLACSALKDEYRDRLEQHHPDAVVYVYLQGSEALIADRLANRQGHFMNSALLHSQLQTLEPPHDALRIEITAQPDEIVHEIRRGLSI